MNIHVHIDRLVLDEMSLGPGDAGRVSAAVEAELIDLVAGGQGNLAADLLAGGAIAEVAAPPVALTGISATAAGREIARSIYGGLGHE